MAGQAANSTPLPPRAELAWWYQFYFATARGQAGYAEYRDDFNRLIWELASPKWKFDASTYARTAASFANPDHVAIVIHNYRWRLGLAQGEPEYDALEKRIAERPVIAVPAITLEGDANGAPHRNPHPTLGNLPASTPTGSSRAASATTFRRKLHRPSLRRWSRLTALRRDEIMPHRIDGEERP